MLVFDTSKNKKIQMALESSGITDDKLKFKFVIVTENVEYGFPCAFNEGKVLIDIPPLEDIIKDVQSGTYTARLDVTGDDKYYLKPFNESVQIKTAPRIKKVDLEDTDLQEDIKLAVSSLIEHDEEEEKPIVEDKEEKDEGNKPEKKTKKSGISAFFDK